MLVILLNDGVQLIHLKNICNHCTSSPDTSIIVATYTTNQNFISKWHFQYWYLHPKYWKEMYKSAFSYVYLQIYSQPKILKMVLFVRSNTRN